MEFCEKLIMLGTGHATVTECYNACFVLRTSESALLVDGGGGNGILKQMKKAEIHLTELTNIFVTHTHIDHLFGIVWILRMMGEKMIDKNSTHNCTVYSHNKVLKVIKYLCRNTLSPITWNNIQEKVKFQKVYDTQSVEIGENMSLQFFDMESCTETQYGFKACLSSGKTLVCLGDALYQEQLVSYVQDADWLICESFCRDYDKEKFRPHELHHNTVLDVAIIAQQLDVKNLVLYHTEDSMLSERKEHYIAEARRAYSGNIYVPNDLESIII